LRQLFEHSGGQKFTTGGIVAAARGSGRFTDADERPKPVNDQ
jgi:hypothetical protein